MKSFLKKNLATLFLLFIISSALKAQTNVSGGIYTNTTWTLAGSPYIVVDTVVVFPGVTLTIDPGVVVKFNNNKRLEIRQGCLMANGTAVDSITFTSNAGSPSPGIWDKIWLNGGVIISQFNYCNFRYALSGLEYVTDSTLIVKNSNFVSNNNGILIGNSTPHARALIDTCNFRNNSNVGIGFSSYPGTMVINYCNITNSGTGFSGLMSSFSGGIIKKSVIDSNQTGLNLLGILADSCIISHNQVGIFSYYYNRIKHCVIDSNTTAGFFAGSNAIAVLDTISDCHIYYNGKGIVAKWTGILHNDIQYNAVNVLANTCVASIRGNIIKNGSVGIDSVSQSDISGNIIENNIVGIRVKMAPNSLTCNRICNNSTYDLENYSSQSFTAPNNYWCTADSLSTTAVIYDGYDNISYGLVSFMPLDTSCYLNGCNLIVNANVVNATCDTCHNGSATVYVANGFAPYTYTWLTSPIQTTQTAVGLAPGTYTVCVTDANGCTACNSNVFVDSTNCTGFFVNTQATNATCATCADGSATVNVTGGTPPFSYTWYTSPIQTTQTATGLSQGTYVVCVSDAYGCNGCDTVTVGIGSCSAHFDLYPDTIPHYYYAVNQASGVPPLTFDWNWGDASPHDTVPYPNHTYAAAGFYTICLTITDSVGCTDSVCTSYFLTRMESSIVYVNVVASLPTGIAGSYDNNFFSVFPNPSFDFININLYDNVTESAQIKIYDVLGKMVLRSDVVGGDNLIDVSKLSDGSYFIEIISADQVGRQKFIKQ